VQQMGCRYCLSSQGVELSPRYVVLVTDIALLLPSITSWGLNFESIWEGHRGFELLQLLLINRTKSLIDAVCLERSYFEMNLSTRVEKNQTMAVKTVQKNPRKSPQKTLLLELIVRNVHSCRLDIQKKINLGPRHSATPQASHCQKRLTRQQR